MRIVFHLTLTLAVVLPVRLQATDTLKVMSYNLLNFPSTSPNRIDTLEIILSYVKPDILMVCEITSAAGIDNILMNALNVGGETAYEAANFVVGPDTKNGLFYNSEKLVLVEQNTITTALRDIDEYVLYHIADDIATTSDTVFFYVYMCHLKASTGFEAERNLEAQTMKNYMATRSNRENILIGGDFNMYSSSTEPAWNTILTGAGVTIKDPINSPGNWNSNAGFAPIHTQSTRLLDFDGGSTGGLDDRFDIIFMSPDLNDFGNGAKYITGTYKAFGQDGLHFNKALIDAPVNTSKPWSVISALYHMADHLPVYMEIEVATENVGLDESETDTFLYYDKASQSLYFRNSAGKMISGKCAIYDLAGNLALSFESIEDGQALDVSRLESGVYILRSEDGAVSLKFRKD